MDDSINVNDKSVGDFGFSLNNLRSNSEVIICYFVH